MSMAERGYLLSSTTAVEALFEAGAAHRLVLTLDHEWAHGKFDPRT